MKEVLLIGCGGHARSLIDLVQISGFKAAGIYDEHFKAREEVSGVKLLGGPDAMPDEVTLVLAIGNSHKRADFFNCYTKRILEQNLVHPSAVIARHSELGSSNQIFARAVVNPEAVLGKNNIINTGAILEHEVRVGSHCHIAVGAILLGRVSVGDFCFIGAGSVVKDGVSICDGVTVGANSFVNESITIPGTYVGGPARKIK